jgi:hypothetical protein
VQLVRHVRHLVVRFFSVLRSTPLGPHDQDEVNALLAEPAAALFWQQDPIDQRHAFQVAQRVRQRLGEDRPALAAALLHDVGKRHSAAGPIGRSLATVLGALRLPVPPDWRRYLDHGELGAADLRAIGADALTVAFAAGRRGEDGEVRPEVWEALLAADDA